jgi:hypothetical protein
MVRVQASKYFMATPTRRWFSHISALQPSVYATTDLASQAMAPGPAESAVPASTGTRSNTGTSPNVTRPWQCPGCFEESG